ncbi:hypothetical protein Q7C15_17375 [Aeromonas salmonicida]|uniref:hypothetical protein n=1 Tax=Aeromonas salmonicida TaxID=645 RepID=UPI0035C0C94A
MSEFLNRIKAQSEMLNVVNALQLKEELFGLSSGAIDRWVKRNSLDESSILVDLVKKTGAQLFFLANKSQEQITEDYQEISLQVANLIELANAEVSRLSR